MTRSTFGIALYGLIIGGLIGSWLTFAYAKAPETRTPDEWVEYARERELTPCFSDLILARLYIEAFKDQGELSEAEKIDRYGPDRIITGSHHKGIVVPEDCFAVANGLFGFNVTFWRRPYQSGGYDMSIPYWNPDPDQIGVN